MEGARRIDAASDAPPAWRQSTRSSRLLHQAAVVPDPSARSGADGKPERDCRHEEGEDEDERQGDPHGASRLAVVHAVGGELGVGQAPAGVPRARQRLAVDGAVDRQKEGPGIAEQPHRQGHGHRQAGSEGLFGRAAGTEDEEAIEGDRRQGRDAVIDVDRPEVKARFAAKIEAAGGAAGLHPEPSGKQAARAAPGAAEAEGVAEWGGQAEHE